MLEKKYGLSGCSIQTRNEQHVGTSGAVDYILDVTERAVRLFIEDGLMSEEGVCQHGFVAYDSQNKEYPYWCRLCDTRMKLYPTL